MRNSLFRALLAVVLALPAIAAQATTVSGIRKPDVRVVRSDVSPPMRSMQVIPPPKEPRFPLIADPGVVPVDRPGFDVIDVPDPLVQEWAEPFGGIPAPTVSFDGPSNTCGGCAPPDPNGAVGPSHVVTMQNSHYAIYDKTGTLLFGPAANNTLWAGFGGACQNENAGDPVVFHDQLADRWVLMQFTAAGPQFFLCVAVSATSDPLGAYQRYAISTGTSFPDYPKAGLWSDGYYFSTREFDPGNAELAGAYAMDRAAVLAGSLSPTVIGFLTSGPAFNRGDGLLPADLDGVTLPPAGSPAYFVGSMDNGGPDGAPQDALYIWEFDADFVTPGNSTFTLQHTIPISAYDTIFGPCGGGRACIPQPGTTNRLDILSYRQRPMHRAAYRNFGTHESLVTNQSVEAVANIAGIRWWELRDLSTTPTLFQEGTYAPGATDGIHRWMGSIAMDSAGNMALGYSASDATSTFPSSWYTGRLAGDTLGTMPQGEESFVDGTGSQTGGGNRWGDYTAMTVDPVDDCTFWYVNEYVPTTSATGYRLRVGAFRFNQCGSPDFFLAAQPAAQTVCVGTDAVYTINVGSVAGYSDNVTLSAGGNPAGTTVGFSTNPVTPPGPSTFTIGNTAGATPGPYTVTVTGTAAGPLVHTTDVSLQLINANPAAPTLTTPPNGSSGVSTSPTLAWNAVAGATSYLVEVDDNADFSSPEFSDTVTGTTVDATGLATDTLYNWRVTANNACGGTASSTFTFTTGVLFCSGTVTIPNSGTGTPYPSTVAVSVPGSELASLSLEITGLTHTFPDDIDLLLVGPGGQTLVVMSDVGGSSAVTGINLTLDDAAAAILPDAGPLVTGSFRPSNVGSGDAFAAPAPAGPHGNPAPAGTATLTSVFGGTNPNGNWNLFAVDDAGGDLGSITSWCVVPVLAEPDIAVDPAAIAETVAPDTAIDVPLDIDNIGTGTLDWTIEEEPAPGFVAPRVAPLRPFDPDQPAADTADGSGIVVAEVRSEKSAGPLWEAPQGTALWDNGPLVTHPGGGSGGADLSAVQTALGLSTFGFGAQATTTNRVADDFTVDAGGWNVDTVTFFSYQTGSTTTCTIDTVRVQIWDGPPNAGGTVVFGDLTTNRFVSCAFSNIYRATDTAPTNNQRPLMAVTAAVDVTLDAGTYWIDVQLGGTLASGPWVPPTSLLGATDGCASGNCNGLQFTTAWNPLLDTGTAATQQDIPFVIDGLPAICASPSDVPWLSLSATSGSTPAGGTSTVDVTLDTTGLAAGVYEANLCIESDDPDTPLVVVPVTLTADSMPFIDGFETGNTSRWSATQN